MNVVLTFLKIIVVDRLIADEEELTRVSIERGTTETFRIQKHNFLKKLTDKECVSNGKEFRKKHKRSYVIALTKKK